MKSVQTSSYRDRTHEFSSITERLRKSLTPSIGVNGSGSGGGSRSSVAFQSEFNKRASKIGYGIHHTSQKLAKLAKCELIVL
ncbi:putative syntaxin-5, Sly1p-binding domain-containing protein [Helianthus anomalus]